MKKTVFVMTTFILAILLIGIVSAGPMNPWRKSWMKSQCGDGVYNDWETNERCPGDCPTPGECFDTDGDNLNDDAEILYGTDPEDPDSDDDQIIDFTEIYHGTDPLNSDTDGDGVLDYDEVLFGHDPRDPSDYPLICYDTDGIDFHVRGSASGGLEVFSDEPYEGGTDYCVDGNTVHEYFCAIDRVHGNEGDFDCPSGDVCADGACVDYDSIDPFEYPDICGDTDGIDLRVRGMASGGTQQLSDEPFVGGTDYCVDGNTVHEYFCIINKVEGKEDDYDCSSGDVCADGACVDYDSIDPFEYPDICGDTDGIDIRVRGTASGGTEQLSGEPFVGGTDYCVDDNTVHEYFCIINKIEGKGSDFDCGFGNVCRDGACVPE